MRMRLLEMESICLRFSRTFLLCIMGASFLNLYGRAVAWYRNNLHNEIYIVDFLQVGFNPPTECNEIHKLR